MRYRVKDYKAFARQALLGHYGLVIGAGIFQSAVVFLFLFLACIAFGLGFAVLLPAAASPVIREVQEELLPFAVAGNLQVAFAAGCAILTVLFVLLFLAAAFLLSLGQLKLCLNLCSSRSCGFGDLFYAFRRGSRPLRCLGVMLLLTLLLFLLSFLSVGLCLGLGAAFSMSPELESWVFLGVYLLTCLLLAYPLMLSVYIIVDRPDTRVLEAFQLSWRYMKGRRWQYFWLTNFSFLLWGFLLYLTFFTAFLWIGPYITCTSLFFYLDASGRLQQRESAEKAADGTASPADGCKEETSDAAAYSMAAQLPASFDRTETVCAEEAAHQTKEEEAS